MPATLSILETETEVRIFLGPDPADEASPIDRDDLDPRALQALETLTAALPDGATLTAMRDWEGCLIAIAAPDTACRLAGFDVVALTSDGKVGHGGVNLPRYYPSAQAFLLEGRWPGAVLEEESEDMRRFREALQAFKQAAHALDRAWGYSGVPGDVLGHTYPEGWLSFDEEVLRIEAMEILEEGQR